MELDGELVALKITHPHPKKTISILKPLNNSETMFKITEGDPFFPLGETVSFTIGKDGTAQRMVSGRAEFTRVD